VHDVHDVHGDGDDVHDDVHDDDDGDDDMHDDEFGLNYPLNEIGYQNRRGTQKQHKHYNFYYLQDVH
jgi:hypothetical protein